MKRFLISSIAASFAVVGLVACTSPQSESLERIADNSEPTAVAVAEPTTQAPVTRESIPAPAPAPSGGAGDWMEEAYIAALDDEGINYSSEANAIDAGYSVCDLLDTGIYDLFETVAFFSENSGYGMEDSGYIVGAAAAAFCPEKL